MSERKSCVSASSDESVKCGNKKRVSPLEAKINQYANKGLVCTEHSLALLHDRKSKRWMKVSSLHVVLLQGKVLPGLLLCLHLIYALILLLDHKAIIHSRKCVISDSSSENKDGKCPSFIYSYKCCCVIIFLDKSQYSFENIFQFNYTRKYMCVSVQHIGLTWGFDTGGMLLLANITFVLLTCCRTFMGAVFCAKH